MMVSGGGTGEVLEELRRGEGSREGLEILFDQLPMGSRYSLRQATHIRSISCSASSALKGSCLTVIISPIPFRSPVFTKSLPHDPL